MQFKQNWHWFIVVLLLLSFFANAQETPTKSPSDTIDTNLPIEKARYLNQLAEERLQQNPYQAILWSDSSIQLLPVDKFSDEMMLALTNKANAYFLLKKYDTSKQCLEEGLQFARRFKNDFNIANMLGKYGTYYLKLGEFDSALIRFTASISLFKLVYENKLDSSEDLLMNLSKTLNNTAQIYVKKGEFDISFSYFIEALKYRELAMAPAESIGKLTINIGGLYIYLKDYKNAESYFLKAEGIFEAIDDSSMLEIIYSNLGVVYKYTGDTNQAISYYKKSLKLNKSLANAKLEATNLGNLGSLYMDQQRFALAEKYFLDALRLGASYTDKYAMAGMYRNLGIIYQKKRQYPKAVKYLNKCLEVAVPEDINTYIVSAELALSEIYAETGNSKAAYEHHIAYHRIYDTINNIRNKNRIAELQTQFETEKKEKEILRLNTEKAESDLAILRQKSDLMKQRFVIFSVLFLLILTAGISYLLFVRIRLRQKNRETELEKQSLILESRLLRSQMNPHFIFNSLNSIQNFILKNEKKEASNYLIKFANLMRNVLNMSREETVLLEDDIATLQINLDLEKLRLKNLFSYTIDIEPHIDPSSIYIPPMLMQPHIENAIKHGMSNKDGGGRIRLLVSLVGNNLHCIIEDNGGGRNKTMQHKEYKSVASKLTEDRFELLRKRKGEHQSQTITDLMDEHGNIIGTRVELFIPFETDK